MLYSPTFRLENSFECLENLPRRSMILDPKGENWKKADFVDNLNLISSCICLLEDRWRQAEWYRDQFVANSFDLLNLRRRRRSMRSMVSVLVLCLIWMKYDVHPNFYVSLLGMIFAGDRTHLLTTKFLWVNVRVVLKISHPATHVFLIEKCYDHCQENG